MSKLQIICDKNKKSLKIKEVLVKKIIIQKFAKDNGINERKPENLIKEDAILSIFKKEMRAFSKELASHEKIRDFRLLANEFTIETGEITPTLKVKRRVIAEKYANEIADIFKDDLAA